jgi:hypothetical protein
MKPPDERPMKPLAGRPRTRLAVEWLCLSLAPLAFCYWLHQYALRSWFWSDDFAWLSLHTQIFDRASFLRTMFEPLAQGTIRPWSERGFFLLFYKLFGFDALPYHVLILATQFANILLLIWIVRKVGGSRLAACLAPALWVANAALVIPLGWVSDYNQILCAFFLLSAFALYLAGRYWAQFAVFVLGFGALEINIVYPAILLAWLLVKRKDWKPAVPLVAVSALYYAIHQHFAPPSTEGPYLLHWDLSIFDTFFKYWKQSWVPPAWYALSHHARWFASLSIFVLSAAALFSAFCGGSTGLFFLAWFLITLAPVLPLREHISHYYLALPTLGLAALLALGLDSKLFHRNRLRLLFALPIVLYLWIHIPATRASSRWNFERSRQVRTLVLGVLRAHELHPGKTILLARISPELYAYSVAHSPFHAADLDQVYLTPDTEFSTFADLEGPSAFRLPAGPTLWGLATDQIEVYQPAGERMRNITAAYRASAAKKILPDTPSRLDVGIPLMAYLLGSTWYPLEGSHRWMPQTATIRIAGPQASKQKLILTGYCPEEQTRPGPLKISISIEGNLVAVEEFRKPEMPFTRMIALPAYLIGKPEMEVRIDVSRTFSRSPGGPPLGLAFGTFEVQ